MHDPRHDGAQPEALSFANPLRSGETLIFPETWWYLGSIVVQGLTRAKAGGYRTRIIEDAANDPGLAIRSVISVRASQTCSRSHRPGVECSAVPDGNATSYNVAGRLTATAVAVHDLAVETRRTLGSAARSGMSSPSITAVLTVYNGEAYVAEALSSILSQTSPPDEIVVVDDGSTDGTQLELAPFRSAIRIVRQENRGHPGGYNRAFAEARGDYIARCDADDIWEPDKLERQRAALIAHPEIDIAAGAARVFGRTERLFALPPGEGLLEIQSFARELYRSNMLCASSTLIRRRLFERIGPFAERLACEDYDFWLQAAGANAVFFYDPQIVVRYRRHSGNVSNDLLGMCRATRFVHGRHGALADDRRLISEVLAADHYRVGRLLVDCDPRRARAEFVGALRHRPGPRAVAWAAALSVPDRDRLAVVARLVATKRVALARWDALRGGWA